MTIEDKFQLHRKYTEYFILESIKQEEPSGLCFTTSFPLLIYLATKQIKSHLITGKVPMEMHDKNIRDVDHFWLQIDQDGTMLDPTIQQFNEKVDPIYIGKLANCGVTRTYKVYEKPLSEWFNETFESWAKPYTDINYPFNEKIKRNVKYSLKLATILHTEIKNMNFYNENIDKLFRIYYGGAIYRFLCNLNNGKINFDIEREKLPYGFDDLLLDALYWEKNRK